MRYSFLLIASWVGVCSVAPAWGQAVNLDAMVQAGKRTEAKLKSTAASWDVINHLQGGTIVRLSIIRHGENQRTIFYLVQDGKSSEFERLIFRDGFWYSSNTTSSGKYRPLEAPMESVIVYLALDRSEPTFATTDRFAGKTAEKIDGDIATFREPLEAAMAKQLQASVDQITAMFAQSHTPIPAETQAQVNFMKDLLANGTPIQVNQASGMITSFGSPTFRSEFQDFKFLDQPDDSVFSVSGKDWPDYTNDPTAGDPNDLLMIGHAPGVKPGDKNYELEGDLMVVKSGRIRRIPFAGPEVLPTCFSKDRKSVFVSGLDAQTGSLRPYEIDLKSRETRPLGSPLLDTGMTLLGDLSPDGTKLAMTHMNPADGILKFTVYVIDVTTGKAKRIGEPADLAYLNWTADGQHLILLIRKPGADLNADTNNTLAMMDLDGKTTELRAGDSPTIMPDGQTILFQEQATHIWHTCDLTGANDKLFAGGMSGYGFPTFAPDGKRLLMMQFVPGGLPKPTVINIGDPQGTLLTPIEGLWGEAAWK